MTEMQTEVEVAAERIAERGRAALVERLRGAYRAAATTHADLVTIDADRLEAMVQDAAGRADGLQWRRALAEVAAGEFGVSVGEALSHPAVAEAQRMVGAPSYEESLAELIARPVPPVAPAGAGRSDPQLSTRAPAPQRAPEEQLERVTADDVVVELMPEPELVDYETELYDVVASFAEEEEEPVDAVPAPPSGSTPPAATIPHAGPAPSPTPPVPSRPPAAVTPPPSAPLPPPAPASPVAPAPWEKLGEALHEMPGGALVPVSSEPDELVFPAVHEGGVANLPKRHEGLGVCVSSAGVDILEGEHEILGRLLWDEIETLQVVSLRPKRRNPEPRARLIIRTPQGDASFGVPGITGDELRDRIEPLLARYGQN